MKIPTYSEAKGRLVKTISHYPGYRINQELSQKNDSSQKKTAISIDDLKELDVLRTDGEVSLYFKDDETKILVYEEGIVFDYNSIWVFVWPYKNRCMINAIYSIKREEPPEAIDSIDDLIWIIHDPESLLKHEREMRKKIGDFPFDHFQYVFSNEKKAKDSTWEQRQKHDCLKDIILRKTIKMQKKEKKKALKAMREAHIN